MIVREDYQATKRQNKSYFPILIISLCLLSFVFLILKQHLAPKINPLAAMLPQLNFSAFQGLDLGFIFAIAFTPTLGHYFIDAFVWKRSFRPKMSAAVIPESSSAAVVGITKLPAYEFEKDFLYANYKQDVVQDSEKIRLVS